jgi:hypothetical protein
MSLLLLFVYAAGPSYTGHPGSGRFAEKELQPEDILWIWEANQDTEDY